MKNNLNKIRVVAVLFSVLMIVVFIFGSLIPYIQMMKYTKILRNTRNYESALEDNSIFKINTPAIDMICNDIISITGIPMTKTFSDVTDEIKQYEPFLQNIIIRCGYWENNSDPVNRLMLSTIYDYLGHITNEKEYFEKSNTLIKSAYAQSPERQSFLVFYALDMFFERKFKESKKIFEKVLKENPQSRQASYYLNVLQGYGVK